MISESCYYKQKLHGNIFNTVYYDMNGNMLYSETTEKHIGNTFLERRLDPEYKGKGRPTHILIYSNFKHGIMANFSHKGRVFDYRFYKGPHRFKPVIEKCKSSIDYVWTLNNEKNINFEISDSVNDSCNVS